MGMALSSMAGVSDSEEEEEGEEECTRGGDTTYIQEQEQLRTSFKEAADLTEDQEEEDSSSMGGLLVLRRKTQEEKVGMDWLRPHKGHVLLLTLSAHAREGYSNHFVCLSVCLSVSLFYFGEGAVFRVETYISTF